MKLVPYHPIFPSFFIVRAPYCWLRAVGSKERHRWPAEDPGEEEKNEKREGVAEQLVEGMYMHE